MRFFLLPLMLACIGGAIARAQSTVLWIPAQRTSWQWQLTETVDLSIDAAVYDIDLFNNSAETVDRIHALGRRAICYVSVGTYENWRADRDQFPVEIRGKRVSGFPDEQWLDIRRLDVLTPIIEDRFDLCKEKGFDGVEPDNVDGFTNNSGFPLTAADQLRFNRFLAQAAHERGLSVGLKNDLEQVRDLVDDFDWALNEQCFQFDECEVLQPFIDAGKAVFHVEYQLGADEFCAAANSMNFNSLVKRIDLDAERTACREVPTDVALLATRNAASGADGPLTPGQLVSLYGRGLGPPDLTLARAGNDGHLPGELAGTEVRINGAPAPVWFAWRSQSAVQIPYGVKPGDRVEVELISDLGRSDRLSMLVAEAAPGVFSADSSGVGQAAVFNQDESRNGPGNPEKKGRIIVLFVTGEGQTTPPGEDGLLANGSLPAPVLPVEVFIGGQRADVQFRGATPGTAGVMQVNVRIPAGAPTGDAVPLLVRVGDVESQPGITVAIAE